MKLSPHIRTGFLTAAFCLLAGRFPAFAIIFLSIAQIIILVAGAKRGTVAAVVPSVISMTILGAVTMPVIAVAYGVVLFIPSILFVWMALYKPKQPKGMKRKKNAPKPQASLDQVVDVLMMYGTLSILGVLGIMNLMGISFIDRIPGLLQELKTALKDVILMQPQIEQTIVRVIPYILVGPLGIGILVTIANGILAFSMAPLQGPVRRRQPFQMQDYTIQQGWYLILGLGLVIGMAFGGDVGLAGRYIVLLSMIPFLLQGLAFVHHFRIMQDGLLRFLFYFLLFSLVPLIGIVVFLGLIDPLFGLRQKIKSR